MLITPMYYKSWYFKLSVQYSIFASCKNREVFLKCVNKPWRSTRFLKFVNVQSIQYYKKDLIHSDYFNFYYSLAEYENGLPYDLKTLNSFGKDERNDARKDWNENHRDYIKGFDLLVDIDSEEEHLNMALESARIIKRLFDRFDCPYFLRFSGRGFHFVLPYSSLGVKLSPREDSFFKFYASFLKKLHDGYSEMVDEGIADSRRVTKVPYSLSVYPGGNAFVCFPINSDDEINFFKWGMTLPNYWITSQKDKIFKRGEHCFNKGGTAKKLFEFLKLKDGEENSRG